MCILNMCVRVHYVTDFECCVSVNTYVFMCERVCVNVYVFSVCAYVYMDVCEYVEVSVCKLCVCVCV